MNFFFAKCAMSVDDVADQFAPEGLSSEFIYAIVRSVMRAMRDPTEAMVAAGAAVECVDRTFAEDVANAWQAMIDEALKSD